MKKYISIFIILLVSLIILFKVSINISEPTVYQTDIINEECFEVSKDFYVFGNNWLRKNQYGLWEMYIEGEPFERGVAIGKLTHELNDIQERIFLNTIKKYIKSNIYLYFLKHFVLWYNRNIDSCITDEYKLEIYGIAKAETSDEFSFIGPKYLRLLNYHAAHDIAHLLLDKNIVGCSTFAVWGNKTSAQEIIHARNFDFYGGEGFSDNNIICFYNPANGYKFVSICWASMIGVVSGMNEKGLAVTINAAKGNLPKGVGTPISIVVREVLQYAKNLDEAYDIIKKRKVFVSESIFISSAFDKKVIIVEKTPDDIAIYESKFDSKKDFIISTNHFLSDKFLNSKTNLENMKNSASVYRYKRIEELITKETKFNEYKSVDILRDQRGLGDKNIGMGNEKAINQLIAHHSIIFAPQREVLWISIPPYQLGKYIAYDLKKVFINYDILKQRGSIVSEDLIIDEDPFLNSSDYLKFKRFKQLKKLIKEAIKTKKELKSELLDEFVETNPEYYEVYYILGKYYYKMQDLPKADYFFNTALTKEIPRLKERETIVSYLNN